MRLFNKGFNSMGEIQKAAGSAGKVIDYAANATGSAAEDITGKIGGSW